jgi:hypothetical protein
MKTATKILLLSLILSLLLQCGDKGQKPQGSTGATNSSSTGSGSADLSFALLDAASGSVRSTVAHNTQLPASTATAQVTLQARSSPLVKSVIFTIDGKKGLRTDNAAPFTLTGEEGAPFSAYPLKAGSHMLTADAYTEAEGKGTLLESQTIVFSVARP